MLVEIKHRRTGAVLFAHHAPKNCAKVTLRLALESKAYLRGANLSGAYLREANLSEANLSEANLSWAYLDFSCWPMWCGSKRVKVDGKLARQLAAHFCVLDCDDPEYQAARVAVLEFAKGSHRAGDLGL